jgi:hypothetical protein
MWNGQPVLFMIVQSPQGTGWVSPMPPRQLLRLLVQMTEDVREQAQAQFVAETSDQRVQVVPALPRPV